MSRKRSLEELEAEEIERRNAQAEEDRIIEQIADVIADCPKALARILYNLGCRSPW